MTSYSQLPKTFITDFILSLSLSLSHTHTHSQQAQSYPVDVSDIQSMLQRAADTVSPLIDQMYEKATQAHKSIFEVSVTKFDQGFRVQNARRLLKWVEVN